MHEEYEDLLALDALDALDTGERAKLDAHLRDCPACRRGRDEMREAYALTGLTAGAVAPPSELRARVLATMDTPVEQVTAAPVVRPFPVRWLAAAAVVVLCVAGGWATLSLSRRTGEVEALRAELAAARDQAAASSAKERELARKLEALTAGATTAINLTGQEAAPKASANVFINAPNRTALVFFNNLPATPSDKSYQLWIIRADQPAPQSAGVFQVGPDGKATLGLKDLPLNTEIKAFALTLEPKGGVPSPTGAKFLIGS